MLVGGFERLLNDVMVGPSTHMEPDWEAGFAVFPLLLQTRLWVDSHPDLRGCLWMPEKHAQEALGNRAAGDVISPKVSRVREFHLAQVRTEGSV